MRRHVIKHGTNNEYQNYGCRCDKCKAAGAAYQRKRRQGLCRGGCGRIVWVRYASGFCSRCAKDNVRKPLEHGTSNGYLRKRCRCDKCRAWAARERCEYRRTHPEQRELEKVRDRIRKRRKRHELSAEKGKV